MIGTLVDQGKLTWDSTLADVFADAAPAMHPELPTGHAHPVTFASLGPAPRRVPGGNFRAGRRPRLACAS